MTAASIPATRGGAYARYLEGKTIAPERGDYYLTPDGEMTQAARRWLADPATLERLGVRPGGSADGEDFVSLMEGRHPQTGRWLRRAGADGGRGGGIDNVFSAPKSVSVAWALADPWQREQIENAHANAVEQTVEYMRERVPVVRRRYGGEVVEEPAKDLIAVEYRHTTARGVSGASAPDPQLHSHVVITSAIREDDRIVAVASRPVFRAAGELGAFYRSVLAEELAREGYRIDRGTGRDGKYFEIAGVPEELREAFSGRSREVARAADRFRARYGRAPERGELRNLALENRRAKQLATRSDLENAWRETARRYDFGPDEALRLLAGDRPPRTLRPVEDRIEERLTERHAVFEARDLRTVALEQTAGELTPHNALQIADGMIRDRRILTFEGGRMTTLAIRAQEQAIERRTTSLARPAGRDVGHRARSSAAREVAERIGSPLTAEQARALLVLTGPERATALVGPAGTGKGVVIDATARAEQLAGQETLGIAVSGSTAERLSADSPALQGQALTLDALIARANTGSIHVGPDTTVILDEAGMADHKRLDALTELVERTGAKLIAVGDGKQLPSIGPGGMFDRLTQHVPAVELETIHRTKDPDEQKAWQALRAGEPERAMAHYQARGRLHLADTRDEAAESAVQTWAQLTEHHDIRQVALIADASNKEIDKLNARAQHLRAQRGELGPDELPLSSVHYGLRQGDHVAFIAQHRPPGQARVENGTRGEITDISRDQTVTLALDGSHRTVRLAGEDVESLRLAYAQHVYRQQGATVDRAVVLTGGWQTSRETAYVQATRARHGTDWYLARDQLGEEGQDPDRITRLAQRMSHSQTRTPSIAYHESDAAWNPTRDPLRLRHLFPHQSWLVSVPRRDAPNRAAERGR
ncbi:MAG TPA: MobF family relaxase [Solirubrobacteraceae bacterium]|jgi:conjugative relaxase-like TrwC/TraI family protein|nr:MobF family relaxase [Solirubrobacteraceae bacterium]